jgi:oxygen-independent coproporphyrinogen-3 oxidase
MAAFFVPRRAAFFLAWLRMIAEPTSPLALYIHWPWCLSKCPYCDFASRPRTSNIDEEQWRMALLAELDQAAGEIDQRELGSIFFGGGTPSLMPPSLVEAIISRASQHWPATPNIEITLEANPGTVDSARFADFRAAGVNRLSLGVQALNDRDLRALGRLHDAKQAKRAIKAASEIFPRFSFDLIYARPGQDMTSWRAELTEALKFGAEHLSLYQLTVEEGTAFHAKGVGEAEEGLAADLFTLTREMTAKANLPAYEISNHARQGAECRHNLVYWRGEDYVGIGPAAHGRVTLEGRTVAIARHAEPKTWLAAVAKQGHGTSEQTELLNPERIAELLLMGLRLTTGLDRSRFLAQTGIEIEKALNAEALAELSNMGWLTCDDAGLRATEKGFPLLNELIGKLLG